ncbi:cyclin-D3-1-like [Apium graveolens]|uniref:cyclin-D3-1-like n=1 Tax=Apium graveolens TaxID=4045 RepID=UPI003D794CF1
MPIFDHYNDYESFSLDSLFCEEEVGIESLEQENELVGFKDQNFSTVLEQDLSWDDEELVSLFTKEKQTHLFSCDDSKLIEHACVARGEVVDWMLRVKAHYGFSAVTAVLSINFFDRFMLCSLNFQDDKPWMVHLAAVTCLSLAAKVDEVQVPLLLDLQVEDSKYVFDAKTIQRMELLVMSTLQWRLNPVTPLSFLDHTTRRLGLKTDLQWEFFKKCEDLILSVVADWRSVRYLPSVLATSTMLHIIHQVEPFNAIEYQDHLLSILKTTKEQINECYGMIVNISNTCWTKNYHKRKYNEASPTSPTGVIDASFSYSESDSLNDSWESSGSSVCSSPHQPFFKKIKTQEEDNNSQMPSLN